MTTNSSPFIEKLQQILNDPNNIEIISFNQGNSRLEISNKKKLQIILPKYFRHGRFQSFVRQLNWYGFYKINNKSINCYSHPDLEKGNKLSSIKSRRKTIGNKGQHDKKSQQNIREPQFQSSHIQFSNQNVAFFVPIQNKISYDAYTFGNQIYPMDTIQMCMFKNLGGTCPIYYSY